MAIAKCEQCGKPAGSKKNYTRAVKPMDYPTQAVLCNAAECLHPAVLWLDSEEDAAYGAGERVFNPITGAVKI